jgi:tripartite-type tricarboxylate transporter receptor subunit TctC
MKRLSFSLALMVLALFTAASTSAQDFSRRPVTLVVPFGAGSSDALARIVGEKMSPLLGTPVVVENKPGGNGIVAAEFVRRQPPDGHTIQMCLNSTNGLLSLFTKDVPFHPFDDFTMIGGFATSPFVLLVHSSVPAKSLPEFLEYAKANPQRRGVGSGGVGSIPHLAVELLNQASRIGFEHIPYRGGGPALNDLVAGHLPILFNTIGPAAEHVQAGTIRMVAVMGEKRLPSHPDLPAMGETIKGFDIPEALFGLCGPKGVPANVVARLNDAVGNALRSPDVVEKLRNLSFEPAPMSSVDFEKRLRADYAVFQRITSAAGIVPQ